MSRSPEENILCDLVEIPSVTDNRAANDHVLDYVQGFAHAHGMHIERTEHDGYGALVATTQPTKTPRVMLSAHVDVVPGPDELFHVRKKDGRLHGRGVLDMKFAVAGYLAVTSALRHELGDYDYGITITTDEETRNQGVLNLLKDGYLPHGVVLLDGGDNWQLETAAKGAWTTKARIAGKAAHGSRPWEGDSATFKMLDMLQEARQLFAGQGPGTDTLNVSLLSAGEAINQIPAESEAALDIRVVSHENLTKVKEQITELYERYGAKWWQTALFPPLVHDMESPYLTTFAQSIQEVTGIAGEGVIATGASDAANYYKYGIPCVVTRPRGGGMHTEREWLDRKSFSHLVPILGRYLERTARLG